MVRVSNGIYTPNQLEHFNDRHTENLPSENFLSTEHLKTMTVLRVFL